MTIQRRKDEHIRICLEEDVAHSHNYWDDVHLRHVALPEIDLDDVDLSCTFMGKGLRAPLMITAITGGVEEAGRINGTIAEVCADLGIGMGVGSQRVALEDPSTEHTFTVVKGKGVPLVFGNLGISQFADRQEHPYGEDELRRAMEMVGADAVAIHLNMAQEVIQPGGDPSSKGALERLSRLAVDFPLVAKETGCGIDQRSGTNLARAGFRAMDISGVSGTSFPAVERRRADGARSLVSKPFDDWGIPAPASIIENRKSGIPVIASGGIRNGVDVAKALALGARLVGIAGNALPHAVAGAGALMEFMEGVIEQTRMAVFLAGGRNPSDPSALDPVCTAPLVRWLP